MKEMSGKRTNKAIGLIEEFDGKVSSMYALLGEHDLLLIVDFPSIEDAMQASVALSKLTGIGFSTSPGVKVEDFDKLMANA